MRKLNADQFLFDTHVRLNEVGMLPRFSEATKDTMGDSLSFDTLKDLLN